MRKLILPGDRKADAQWVADKATSRYLIRVLRLAAGDGFPAADESGNRFTCVVESADPAACSLRLEWKGSREEVRAASESGSAPGIRIALAQALPKGRKLDLIVRQAVESGVELVVPVMSEHCVAREGKDDDRGRRSRLARVVREALQQSGSEVPSAVAPIVELSGLAEALALAGWAGEGTLLLFCHEKPLAKETLHDYCARKPCRVAVAVGPEGGFSPRECEVLIAAGFRPVHFEGAVLRAETAALYAVAAVKTILAESASWKAAT